MKRRRKSNITSLLSLYFSFFLNKLNCIILLVGILVLGLGLFFLSNPWMDMTLYNSSPTDFHMLYKTEALLICEIFNSVIISIIILSLCIQSTSFDTMFVASIPRRSICIAKLLLGIIISLFILMAELALIEGICYLRYPRYSFSYRTFIGYLYMLLGLIFKLTLGMAIASALSSIFVPFIYLFIQIVVLVVCTNNESIINKIAYVIPINLINNDMNIYMKQPFSAVIWSILLAFLYISVYNIRDLKNN